MAELAGRKYKIHSSKARLAVNRQQKLIAHKTDVNPFILQTAWPGCVTLLYERCLGTSDLLLLLLPAPPVLLPAPPLVPLPTLRPSLQSARPAPGCPSSSLVKTLSVLQLV